MQTHTFPCGCSFSILEPSPEPGVLPLLDLDIEQVPKTCPMVWEMLGRGDTVSVFQLEKKLGQEWSRRLKPETIEHLAALTALLRPGCLNARDEQGVSMTEHFCRRKNNEEPWDDMDESLKPMLAKTYGIVCYQEEFMQIARELAGFDLLQVDGLRRGVAKKKQEVLAGIKSEFLEGCKRVGKLSERMAELVWSWIEASGRYAFNASHAVSYCYISYYTAYAKAHFPVQYFTAALATTHLRADSKDEIRILVDDARKFDVEVMPPDALPCEPYFYTDRRRVYFGLADIKGIGEKQIPGLNACLESSQVILQKTPENWTWFEFMMYALTRQGSQVATKLIRAGACDRYQTARARMLAEYKAWQELTDTEQAWVWSALGIWTDKTTADDYKQNVARNEEALLELQARYTTETVKETRGKPSKKHPEGKLTRKVIHKVAPLRDWSEADTAELEDVKASLEEDRRRLQLLQSEQRPLESMDAALAFLVGSGACSRGRQDFVAGLLEVLRNPGSPHIDTPRRLVLDEEDLLGIPVTCHRLDQVELAEANITVAEFLAGKVMKRMLFGVEVVRVKKTTTKKGKNPGQAMCRCTLSDRTGAVEAVCFPESYAATGMLLEDGALVLVHGERDKRAQNPSIIIQAVWRAQ